MVIFVIVAVILYITVVPWALGFSFVLLGPLGAILLHLQWILVTNIIANHVCQKIVLPNLNWQVYKLTVAQCKVTPGSIPMEEYKNPYTEKSKNDWWWIFGVFGWGKDLVGKAGMTIISFIPVVGPLIVNAVDTNERARKCLQPFFKQQNWSKQQIKQFEINKRADFVGFGLVTGILESIPVLSIITMTSNTVAGALWATNLFKKEETRKKE